MICNTHFFFSIRMLFFCMLIVLCSNVYTQNWNDDLVCDTIIKPSSPLVVECTERGFMSIGFDMGFSRFYFHNETTQWLGSPIGGNSAIYVTFNRLIFGVGFNVATINPKKELVFGSKTLTPNAKMNHLKLDYYIAYSFDFKYNFSIEPRVGVGNLFFQVLNEDELNQKFNLPNRYGLTGGAVVRKYFIVDRRNLFISVYSGLNYGLNNYSKIHSELSGYSWNWSVGISLKGAFGTTYQWVIDAD